MSTNIERAYLTLTSVVFESFNSRIYALIADDLTLTSVVFEFYFI